MARKDIKLLKRVSNLFLDIYLIGYHKKGESIVFIVRTINEDETESVLYSGVVDSYKDGKNQTIELLKSKNIKLIDFLCWTHPDEDHSKGLEDILKDFTNEKTRIVLPPSLLNIRDRLDCTAKQYCDVFSETIDQKHYAKRYDIVNGSADRILQTVEIPSRQRRTPYKLNIKSISPFDKVIDAQYANTKIKKNDFSIALILEFENINILLASDILKNTIELIKNEVDMPEKFNYIKIPHHTSKSSENMLIQFNAEYKAEVACTTVFKSKKIPDKPLLKKYKNYCEKLYCTDCEFTNGFNPTNQFGILYTSINIMKNTFASKCLFDSVEVDVSKL